MNNRAYWQVTICHRQLINVNLIIPIISLLINNRELRKGLQDIHLFRVSQRNRRIKYYICRKARYHGDVWARKKCNQDIINWYSFKALRELKICSKNQVKRKSYFLISKNFLYECKFRCSQLKIYFSYYLKLFILFLNFIFFNVVY